MSKLPAIIPTVLANNPHIMGGYSVSSHRHSSHVTKPKLIDHRQPVRLARFQ